MLKFNKNNNKLLKFSLFTIGFSLIALVLSNNSFFYTPPQINVAEIVPGDEEVQEEFREINVTGSVNNVLLQEHNPAILVTVKYTDANMSPKEKVVSLDYDSNFNFGTITVPSKSTILVSPFSTNYVFFPKEISLNVQQFKDPLSFDTTLKEAAKDNLNIFGQLVGFRSTDGVAYIYGTSSVTGQTIKKIVNIDSFGNFKVEGLESGSYIVAPTSNSLFFVPKHKTINLKNKDFKVNFASAKKLF